MVIADFKGMKMIHRLFPAKQETKNAVYKDCDF
jgi:hypothetical protein